jgi:tubulin monoglycylase TTLL3/8
LTKNQNILINRFNKSPFTSKEGLCTALKEFHWYYEEGKSECFFPRCFNVFNPEELTEFVDNFRNTACISLLRWLVEQHEEKGSFFLVSDDGRVPMTCIQFAMNRCKDFIDYCAHNDIDIEGEVKIWEHDWDVFLTHHYLLTHENTKFTMQEDAYASIDAYVDQARRILERIKMVWPQYYLDGTLNIWIIKPGNKCRGRGIMLMNNIKQIIATVNPPTRKSLDAYIRCKNIRKIKISL